jgi:hypothetical protein
MQESSKKLLMQKAKTKKLARVYLSLMDNAA